jgi:hypothetical protein
VLACDEEGAWLVMPKLASVGPEQMPTVSWGSGAAQDLFALNITDAGALRNWGRTASGDVVLLDYGSEGYA